VNTDTAGGTYGVVQTAAAGDEVAAVTESLRRNGYAVVPGALSRADAARHAAALDRVYAQQCEEVGGEAQLAGIHDAGVARALLAYEPAFLELAAHPLLLAVARAVLGENFVLLMQNGVINRPADEHYQSNWHRDLNYQHWVCSRPLAVSALFCLDPFTAATGGTQFAPGTHLQAEFPSEAWLRANTLDAVAEPGAVIFMDAMVFHRAGRNRSDMVRRAVNHVVGQPILAQQIALPAMLGGRHADDPFLAKYLGYRWNPRSLAEWRGQKLRGGRAGG
jgi:ectoine hydroxylase-related dioxygenase (phytanoyl-CoA dioxygenase family)